MGATETWSQEKAAKGVRKSTAGSMKVGDLVRALIIAGHPLGVIIKKRQSQRFGTLYHVWTCEGQIGSYPFTECQLEKISEA